MAKRIHQPGYYTKAMAFLRLRREEAGLTQNAVAERMGVSHDTYWRWENDETTPTDGQLRKLLKILGVTQEELDAELLSLQDSTILRSEVENPSIQTSHNQPISCEAEKISDSLPVTATEISQERKQSIETEQSPQKGNVSIKNIWPIKALLPIALVTGCLVLSVKGILSMKSLPVPEVVINDVKVGQDSKRPQLFQACYNEFKEILGEPIGTVQLTEISPKGESGEYQKFRKGTVYLSHQNDKAYPVLGYMRRAHNDTGGIAGPHALGFPTSDIASAASSRIRGLTPGTYQRFERGSIYESSYGAYPVVGAMSREHEQYNGTNGKMGFPIGVPKYDDGKIVQKFEGGSYVVVDVN